MFANGTRRWFSRKESGAFKPPSSSSSSGKTKKTKSCSTNSSSNYSNSKNRGCNNSSGSSSSNKHPKFKSKSKSKSKKWVAKTLKQHRGSLLKELDVNKVLPHLVYNRVFSLGEYKEILGQQNQARQAEVFLDRLSSKGPTAFGGFCSVLEEVHPHLLTCLLLDHDDSEMVKSFCSSMQGYEGGDHQARSPARHSQSLPRPPMSPYHTSHSQSLPREQDLSHIPLFYNHPLLNNNNNR